MGRVPGLGAGRAEDAFPARATALRLPTVLCAELWLVWYVFAGVIKAIPVVASTVPVDLTAVFGLLAVVSVLFRVMATGRVRRFPLIRADLWLLSLALVLAVGVLYTAGDRAYALQKVVDFLLLGVLAAYVLPRWMSRTCASYAAFVRRVLRGWVGTAAVLSWVAFLGAPGLGFARSPGGSYLGWGYFLAGAVIAGLSLLLQERRLGRRCVLVASLVLLLGALVYARARGPVISLAAVLVFMVFGWMPISLRRRFVAATVALGVAAAALLAMPPELRHRYEMLLTADVGASVLARADAYAAALTTFIERPFLGGGTGSFSAFHGFQYPHNIVLEALAENGLVGFIALCGFVFSLLRRSGRVARRSDPRERALVVGVRLIFLCMLAGSMFSGDLSSRMLLFSAGLVAAGAPSARGSGAAGAPLRGTEGQQPGEEAR